VIMPVQLALITRGRVGRLLNAQPVR